MRMLTMAACLVLAGSLSVYAQGAPERQASNSPSAQQQAAPAAAQQKISPQKEADIRQLLKVSGSAAMVRLVLANMEKSMRPMITSAFPPGAYRKRLVDLFFQKFNSRATPQEMVDLAIPIYARNLSDHDIKGLIRFYESPLGQRAVKALPRVMAEVQAEAEARGRRWGTESMREVLSEHPELVKELREAAQRARQ